MFRFILGAILLAAANLAWAQMPPCPPDDPHRALLISNSSDADYRDLQTAIDAEGCASYFVDARNYTPPRYLSIRNVSLLIAPLTSERIVMDGERTRRLITIEGTGTSRQEVRLFGFDIRNGRFPGRGGAIGIRGNVEVTIQESSIRTSTADWGGAISVEDGAALNIVPASFGSDTVVLSGNLAEGTGSGQGGGAIYCHDASVKLTDVSLVENHALSRGGVVFAEDCDVEAFDIDVRQGSARDGGGFYCTNSDLTLEQSTLFSLEADTQGGAIWLRNGCSLRMNDVTISSSTAERGGGIRCHDSNITWLGGSIVRNRARGFGGGIGLTRCQLTDLGRATQVRLIDSNEADYDDSDEIRGRGAGIFASDNSTIDLVSTLAPTRITNNAGDVSPGDFEIHGDSGFGNAQLGQGGGVYAAGSDVRLTNAVLAGNTAYEGAAVYLFDAHLDLFDATVEDNVARGYTHKLGTCPFTREYHFGGEGAIRAEVSTATIDRARFAGNVSLYPPSSFTCDDAHYGPSIAVLAAYESDVAVSNAVIVDNNVASSRADMLFGLEGHDEPVRLRLSHVTLLQNQVDQQDVNAVFGLIGVASGQEELIIENSILWYDQPFGDVDLVIRERHARSFDDHPDLDVLNITCVATPEVSSAERHLDDDASAVIENHIAADPEFLDPPENLRLADTSPGVDTCVQPTHIGQETWSHDFPGAARPVDHFDFPGGLQFDAGAIENQSGVPFVADLSVRARPVSGPVMAETPFNVAVDVGNLGLDALGVALTLRGTGLDALSTVAAEGWSCSSPFPQSRRCTRSRFPGGEQQRLSFQAQAEPGVDAVDVTADIDSDTEEVVFTNNHHTITVEVINDPIDLPEMVFEDGFEF